MLFRKHTFAFCFFVAALSFLSYRSLVRIRSFDAASYRKLVQESAELRSRRALERHPAHQMREGVQKDIWTIDGAERLHFRLSSSYSELTLRQKKDKIEAIEELQHFHGALQEKIDAAAHTQQVRTFSAHEGTYYYPSHRFLAQNVHLAFYRLPGNALTPTIQEKPFLTGIAHDAAFNASAKAPSFTAHQISAWLDPERGLP